jgi:hypothetical protein
MRSIALNQKGLNRSKEFSQNNSFDRKSHLLYTTNAMGKLKIRQSSYQPLLFDMSAIKTLEIDDEQSMNEAEIVTQKDSSLLSISLWRAKPRTPQNQHMTGYFSP